MVSTASAPSSPSSATLRQTARENLNVMGPAGVLAALHLAKKTGRPVARERLEAMRAELLDRAGLFPSKPVGLLLEAITLLLSAAPPDPEPVKGGEAGGAWGAAVLRDAEEPVGSAGLFHEQHGLGDGLDREAGELGHPLRSGSDAGTRRVPLREVLNRREDGERFRADLADSLEQAIGKGDPTGRHCHFDSSYGFAVVTTPPECTRSGR